MKREEIYELNWAGEDKEDSVKNMMAFMGEHGLAMKDENGVWCISMKGINLATALAVFLPKDYKDFMAERADAFQKAKGLRGQRLFMDEE